MSLLRLFSGNIAQRRFYRFRSQDPLKKLSYFSSSSSSANDSSSDHQIGEFDFTPHSTLNKLIVNLKTCFALPWERVKNGSVLVIDLKGVLVDGAVSRSGPVSKSSMESKTESKVFLSLSEFSENLRKASHDPRVSALFIHIHTDFECRWGMAQEMGVDITNFRKSNKLAFASVPTLDTIYLYIGGFCNELYLAPPKPESGSGGPSGLESGSGSAHQYSIDYSLYVETELICVGKYKLDIPGSAEKIESDNAIVSDVTCHFLGKFSSLRGLSLTSFADFLLSDDKFDLRNWVVAGLITGLREPDELISSLTRKFGDLVDLKQYSRVRKWTVGLVEGEERIAIIRVYGDIGSSYLISGDDNIFTKIRQVRSSKTYKALIIRVDSIGGSNYPSNLLWREIRRVSSKIPVICSISDHALSGGYMVAMGANVIVANELSLTGSIGVIGKRDNFRKVYARLNNKNKGFFSRGLFARVYEADHRRQSPFETEWQRNRLLFIYKSFLDNVALSRSLSADHTEQIAEGRIWTGKEALSNGLIDAYGGLSHAIYIAKVKAKIPVDTLVRLEDLSRHDQSVFEALRRHIIQFAIFLFEMFEELYRKRER